MTCMTMTMEHNITYIMNHILTMLIYDVYSYKFFHFVLITFENLVLLITICKKLKASM